MANHDVHGEVASGWEGVPAVLRASLEQRGGRGGVGLRVPPRRARRRHRRRHVHARRRRLRPLDPAAGVQHDEGDHGHRSRHLRRTAACSTTTRRSPPIGPSSPPPARVTPQSPSCSATSSVSSPSTASRSSRPSTGTPSPQRSPPPHPSGRSATGTATTRVTYGWLAGELVRRVDGRSLGTFVADEIAKPLGVDLWIGLPESEEARVSPLIRDEQPTDVAPRDAGDHRRHHGPGHAGRPGAVAERRLHGGRRHVQPPRGPRRRDPSGQRHHQRRLAGQGLRRHDGAGRWRPAAGGRRPRSRRAPSSPRTAKPICACRPRRRSGSASWSTARSRCTRSGQLWPPGGRRLGRLRRPRSRPRLRLRDEHDGDQPGRRHAGPAADRCCGGRPPGSRPAPLPTLGPTHAGLPHAQPRARRPRPGRGAPRLDAARAVRRPLRSSSPSPRRRLACTTSS